jgi:hypothetical protein
MFNYLKRKVTGLLAPYLTTKVQRYQAFANTSPEYLPAGRVGLGDETRAEIAQFMRDSIGMDYDLKNILDLARYLIPTPPVPTRWRRRMLALGSGDPTRVICSTRIAQAFQSVGYPILPKIEQLTDKECEQCNESVREILHIRHHSLFTPRDFDVSPYFEIVKPTIKRGFNFKQLEWGTRAVGDSR